MHVYRLHPALIEMSVRFDAFHDLGDVAQKPCFVMQGFIVPYVVVGIYVTRFVVFVFKASGTSEIDRLGAREQPEQGRG